MDWLELTLSCAREAAERLSDHLSDAGAVSVSLSDAGSGTLVEEEPGTAPLWPETRVCALFDADADLDHLVRGLEAVGFGPPQIRRIGDQEWSRAWREHVRPRRYGKQLWVLPSFAEDPAGDVACVRLDPGLAFGTGSHATTALCLEWLERAALRGKYLIDYGCGSGILAIAAVKLGARAACGVDNDPAALDTARENARRNGVGGRLRFHLPADLPADPADVLVANILAGPLIGLASTFAALLRCGGRIALSGILSGQARHVTEAYQSQVAFEDVESRDGWVRLSGVRRSADAR